MASFDRSILPGGKGKISVSLNTKGYQGSVSKRIRVRSNDPSNKVIILRITAIVLPVIEISRKRVLLEGLPGNELTQTVDIKAKIERPLTLNPIKWNLEGLIDYRIETIKKDSDYRVVFSMKTEQPELFRGVLELKTNYTERPRIIIRVVGKTD